MQAIEMMILLYVVATVAPSILLLGVLLWWRSERPQDVRLSANP